MKSKSQTTQDGFLTVPELAKRWRVDKHWVYRNLDLLQIPTLRLGRLIRFSVASVNEWEKQNAQAKR